MREELLKALNGYVWAITSHPGINYKKAVSYSRYLIEKFAKTVKENGINVDELNEFIVLFNTLVLGLYYSYERATREYKLLSSSYSSDERALSVIALASELVTRVPAQRVELPGDGDPWFGFGAAIAFLRGISPDLYAASYTALTLTVRFAGLKDKVSLQLSQTFI